MNVVAVFVGGLIGTGARLGIDALLPHGDAGFPWSTLIINVVGTFALGMLVARIWPVVPEWARAGLGAGLLGSFTTLSAMIGSAFLLTGSGQPIVALGLVIASLVSGIAAALLGLRIGRRPIPPIGPEE